MARTLTEDERAELFGLADKAREGMEAGAAAITLRNFERAWRGATFKPFDDLATTAKDRAAIRAAMLYLIGYLAVREWPRGEEWRSRLLQLLLCIGPQLVSKPGPKRRGATVDRRAKVRAAAEAVPKTKGGRLPKGALAKLSAAHGGMSLSTIRKARQK